MARNTIKEKGTAWERRVADYGAAAGLGWDRAPLRGTADLLDITGSLEDGFLIGCKARSAPRIRADGSITPDRLAESSDEADAAVKRLPAELRDKVTGVQILQRPRQATEKGHVVMTLRDFTRLIVRLRELEGRAVDVPGADAGAA